MTFNPDIHHRRSIRLREYDYSSVGAYFVTVCAQGRACLFGDNANGEIRLKDAGRMVAEWWLKLPERFPGVTVDKYVVMPNHFHGIICITDSVGAAPCGRPDVTAPCGCPDVTAPCGCPDVTAPCGCPSLILTPPQGCPVMVQSGHKTTSNAGDHVGIAPTLGDVMGWFKTMTTNAYIHGVKEMGWPPFPGRLWQRNYFERIIRDDHEMSATLEYVHFNPMKWAADDEYQM